MDKTVQVMVQEIKTTLQRKAFFLVGFGLPLLVGIVAAAVIITRSQPATGPGQASASPTQPAAFQLEGYVDQAGLIKALPPDVVAEWFIPYPDLASAQEALEAGEISLYYVIPADYAATGQLDVIRLEFNPLGGQVFTQGVSWVLLYNLLDQDLDLAQSIRTPLTITAKPLAASKPAAAAPSVFTRLLPSIMTLVLYIVILLPAGMLVNAVTDERKNRVMEVLMTSVHPRQMLAGKFLALGVLGLFQVLFWLGILLAVVLVGGSSLSLPPGFEIPAAWIAWCVIYFLGGYAIYGLLMAGIGALAQDVKDTSGPTLIVVAPLLLCQFLLPVILSAPDGAVSLVLSIFPLTSPVAMVARLTLTTVPLWQPILAALLQALTAVIILRLVERLFRAQLLLTGQPFSLPRYLGALAGRVG